MLPEFLDCSNVNIPFEALLKSLVTIDDNGNAALRIVENADSGEPYFNCDNNSQSFETALKKAIVVVDGKPALNLALVTVAP